MKFGMKKKALIASLLTFALCLGILAGATFAFFTSGLEAFNKAYEEGVIDHVFATNLTYASPEMLAAPWFTQADMSKYMAFVIATLNHDQSLSHLLDPWKRIEALLSKYRENNK